MEGIKFETAGRDSYGIPTQTKRLEVDGMEITVPYLDTYPVSVDDSEPREEKIDPQEVEVPPHIVDACRELLKARAKVESLRGELKELIGQQYRTGLQLQPKK